MGNISESKYDIFELRWNTDNVIVDEIEFLRAELTPKNKAMENLLLSPSMLRVSFFAVINMRLENVCAIIDLLIMMINLWIGMKHHSDKTNILKNPYQRLHWCWKKLMIL